MNENEFCNISGKKGRKAWLIYYFCIFMYINVYPVIINFICSMIAPAWVAPLGWRNRALFFCWKLEKYKRTSQRGPKWQEKGFLYLFVCLFEIDVIMSKLVGDISKVGLNFKLSNKREWLENIFCYQSLIIIFVLVLFLFLLALDLAILRLVLLLVFAGLDLIDLILVL